MTEENLQARIRGVLMMALSNKLGALVLTTSNKSESATGYTTLYGDMTGGLAVIQDVPKLLVYELSRYANQRAGREVVPITVIEKPPSAELRPDQFDEQSLMPYERLDPDPAGVRRGRPLARRHRGRRVRRGRREARDVAGHRRRVQAPPGRAGTANHAPRVRQGPPLPNRQPLPGLLNAMPSDAPPPPAWPVASNWRERAERIGVRLRGREDAIRGLAVAGDYPAGIAWEASLLRIVVFPHAEQPRLDQSAIAYDGDVPYVVDRITTGLLTELEALLAQEPLAGMLAGLTPLRLTDAALRDLLPAFRDRYHRPKAASSASAAPCKPPKSRSTIAKRAPPRARRRSPAKRPRPRHKRRPGRTRRPAPPSPAASAPPPASCASTPWPTPQQQRSRCRSAIPTNCGKQWTT